MDDNGQVKIHILLMDPLPDVKETFSVVSREESHEKGGSLSNSSSKTQGYAFAGKFSDQKKIFNTNRTRGNRIYNVRIVVWKVILLKDATNLLVF